MTEHKITVKEPSTKKFQPEVGGIYHWCPPYDKDDKEGRYYILTMLEYQKYSLICLTSGNRFGNPVADPILAFHNQIENFKKLPPGSEITLIIQE